MPIGFLLGRVSLLVLSLQIWDSGQQFQLVYLNHFYYICLRTQWNSRLLNVPEYSVNHRANFISGAPPPTRRAPASLNRE